MSKLKLKKVLLKVPWMLWICWQQVLCKLLSLILAQNTDAFIIPCFLAAWTKYVLIMFSKSCVLGKMSDQLGNSPNFLDNPVQSLDRYLCLSVYLTVTLYKLPIYRYLYLIYNTIQKVYRIHENGWELPVPLAYQPFVCLSCVLCLPSCCKHSSQVTATIRIKN